MRKACNFTWYVCVLSYCYSNQKYAVRWGNANSSYFEISNGIRLGGILSPILYNLYTESLSTQLLSSRIGCHIAEECVNYIAYADDMVLLAPPIKALQTLIDICFKFAGENDILYNETKIQCMAFWPRSYTQSVLPSAAIDTPSLRFVDEAVYIGHIISPTRKDISDVNKQVKKLKILTQSEMLLFKGEM